jgi:hypothetical protein
MFTEEGLATVLVKNTSALVRLIHESSEDEDVLELHFTYVSI